MNNYRDWIEFGKMYEKLRDESEHSIETYEDVDEAVVSIRGANGTKKFNGYSLEDTMKDAYTSVYRGIENWEEINLDIDPKILDQLYELADEEGVTLDEIIESILRSYIDYKEDLKDDEETEREQIIKEIRDINDECLTKYSTSSLKQSLKMMKEFLGK